MYSKVILARASGCGLKELALLDSSLALVHECLLVSNMYSIYGKFFTCVVEPCCQENLKLLSARHFFVKVVINIS